MFEETLKTLKQIKQDKPLILNISNYVTMDFIANGLLSLGAAPIMSQAEEEIHDLLLHTNTVTINLGTLNPHFISLCEHTCHLANQSKKPLILDPVGAGASQYRTKMSLQLLNKYDFAIIRGNAGEIIALAGGINQSKGVDSLATSDEAIESALLLSKKFNACIAISGKTDIIVKEDSIIQLDSGSPLMPFVTGTGCLLTAIIAAFHAIEKDAFSAVHLATLFYGICGEIAEKTSVGPASFKINFLDALYSYPQREYYEKI